MGRLQSPFSTAAAVASSSAKKMHSPIMPGSASSTASSVAAFVVVGGGGCLDPAQSPFWRRRRRWRSSSPSAAAAVVVVPSSPSSCDHRRSYPPSSSARWWHVVGVGGGASVPLFGVDMLPAARGFGSGPAAGRGTSPRVVLEVSATASMDEIKASFRKLAKKYHPDLRMHHRRDDGDDGDDDDDNGVGRGGDRIMAELIAAYESLTNGHDDDFRTGGGNSMVALACETYTLDELRGMRRAFDVRSFRVEFGNHRSNDDEDVMDGTTSALDASTRRPHDDGHSGNLDPFPVLPLDVHPDDSISDLKRHIQNRYAEEWGLGIGGQRVDRDGLYLGWELVYCSRNDDDDDARNGKGYGSVLSYHLFLSSYGIREGDLVHAVIGRKDAA